MPPISFPLCRVACMERAEINRVSVADQVASILRQRILNGELGPGTQLQQVPMATSLGVARDTMREPTRILSVEGVLRRSVPRGVSVSQLFLRDTQEIYQVRWMLETSAVLAATSGRTKNLPELRAALQGYEQAVRDRNWTRAVSFDLQFHSLLIRFHQNWRLEAFHQKLIGDLRTVMVLIDRSHDDPGRLIPVHKKMYQLLAAGKLQACANTLAQHLNDSETRLRRVMEQQALKNGQETGNTKQISRLRSRKGN
jgi:DNA-binding GntR family transcriptional regulator